MGKLNIAHHKSYHPYRADNRERVRRDEERAAAEEAGDRARVMQADSEARIADLRRKSRKNKSKEEEESMAALDRQLKGKGRAEEDRLAEISSITTDRGHINFWADMERGKAGPSRENSEYKAEKKAAEDKWDEQITMYLKAPPKSWYDSRDGLNSSERGMTQQQRQHRSSIDQQTKIGADPLATMEAYLKRRDEVKAAQARQADDPWSDTPRTLKLNRTPVHAPLLRQRGRRGNSKSPEIKEGPQLKASSDPSTAESAERALARQSVERQRAKALIASKRAASVASTPRSEFGYQTGMYNKAATKEAHYGNLR